MISADGDHLEVEDLVPLGQALRSAGVNVAPSTATRWIQKPLRDGRQLEARRVGGRWFTSPAAVRRFVAQGAPTAAPSPRPDPIERPRRRLLAEQRLRARGLM